MSDTHMEPRTALGVLPKDHSPMLSIGAAHGVHSFPSAAAGCTAEPPDASITLSFQLLPAPTAQPQGLLLASVANFMSHQGPLLTLSHRTTQTYALTHAHHRRLGDVWG